MTVVKGRIHPISIHGTQILLLEFNERRSQFGCVAEGVGEGVCWD